MKFCQSKSLYGTMKGIVPYSEPTKYCLAEFIERTLFYNIFPETLAIRERICYNVRVIQSIVVTKTIFVRTRLQRAGRVEPGSRGQSIHFPNDAGSCPLPHGKRPRPAAIWVAPRSPFVPYPGWRIFLLGKPFLRKRFPQTPSKKLSNWMD